MKRRDSNYILGNIPKLGKITFLSQRSSSSACVNGILGCVGIRAKLVVHNVLPNK